MSGIEAFAIGPGSYRCGEVAELYKTHPEQAHDGFYAWAQGCLSGMNIGGRGAALALASQPGMSEAGSLSENMLINLYPPGWDFEMHWSWLMDYCDQNPMDTFVLAVVELYQKLEAVQNSD